jgi:hypothetical protein
MSQTITPAQLLAQDRMRWPGMLPAEILIWREWMKAHGGENDSYEGNIRIGAGHDPGPTWPDYIRKMAIQNTQLRIDAVGYKGLGVTLYEVKRRAGASAVGQLLTYDAVWQQDHPGAPPPGLVLVTNQAQANVVPLLTKAGIRLDLVPVDFSLLATGTYYPGKGAP